MMSGRAFIFVASVALAIAAAAVAQERTMTKLQAATSLAPMLERVLPGVVSILVTGEHQPPVTVGPDGKEQDRPAKEPFQAGGSGVVVDSKHGVILTNNHVIADATRIDVVFSDGRMATGKLIGTDVATDVAVVQVATTDLTQVPYGDSDAIRIGDFVAAVGAPYGLEGSASQGIVSATARTDIGYEIFEDFLQVDAAINPGNSGGALVDIDGRLIGINTASGAQKLRTQGIGFAIPINLARAIANELITTGTFTRGSIGIVSESLNFEMARQMGLNITRGAAVKMVVPGSPADQAGIKKGDVIVSIGNKPVRGLTDYVARVATTPIGKVLPVEFVSGNARKVINLTVGECIMAPTPETPPMAAKSLSGLTLGAMLPGFKPFGTVQGARILSVDGDMTKTGIQPDDVITKVDNSTVRAPQDVFDWVETKVGRYRLEIYRDGRKLWFWIGS